MRNEKPNSDNIGDARDALKLYEQYLVKNKFIAGKNITLAGTIFFNQYRRKLETLNHLERKFSTLYPHIGRVTFLVFMVTHPAETFTSLARQGCPNVFDAVLTAAKVLKQGVFRGGALRPWPPFGSPG